MKKNAFVLIFTITILSLVTLLTQQLLRVVYVGMHFDKAMINREHAEMLALGGINLAIAQLTPPEIKKENVSKEAKDNVATKKFVKRILPNLNRWQVFKLAENVDGIDGTVQFCISCEDGKININEIFDFEKQTFLPEYKNFLQTLKIKGQDKSSGELFKKLLDYLKKRKQKIEDVSQLQANALTNITQLFYLPPKRTEKERDTKSNETLAIQDIFTIWSSSNKLEALFLSDALCAILGLRRPQAYDATRRISVFEEISKSFDPNTDENSPQYWTKLQPLYGQKGTAHIESKKIFAPKFEPKVYSVLSSGKVGNVEQRVLAIIEKVTQTQSTDKTKQKETEKKEPKPEPFKIVRLYWI